MRYFFDIIDNGSPVKDEQGGEYPDLESAKQEAARVLAQVAVDLLPSSEGCTLAIEVRDERGDRVLATSLTFEVQRLSGL